METYPGNFLQFYKFPKPLFFSTVDLAVEEVISRLKGQWQQTAVPPGYKKASGGAWRCDDGAGFG